MAGIVGGAVGVVSIGIGVTFAIMAKSSYNEGLEDHCAGGNRFACDATGAELWERAESQKVVSTVTIVAGAALLAAGAALFFLAPSSTRKSPAIGRGGTASWQW